MHTVPWDIIASIIIAAFGSQWVGQIIMERHRRKTQPSGAEIITKMTGIESKLDTLEQKIDATELTKPLIAMTAEPAEGTKKNQDVYTDAAATDSAAPADTAATDATICGYTNLGIAQVDSSLNVREQPDTNSDIVGKMLMGEIINAHKEVLE